jgi:4'-phosphopantetheinyl transferase
MRSETLEAHVWLASLDVPPSRREELGRSLSADERQRAGRYRVAAARERFVVGRGLLREVLAEYSGLSPAELRFVYPCLCGRPDCAPARRKPRLEPRSGAPPLRFNLSHTDGVAMLAVTGGSEVGVDVERIRPRAAVEAIAERVLGRCEAEALRALPDAERVEAFYRSWTRREACAKARGTGLAPPADAAGWWLSDLPAPPGCVAALAVEGGPHELRIERWPRRREALRTSFAAQLLGGLEGVQSRRDVAAEPFEVRK